MGDTPFVLASFLKRELLGPGGPESRMVEEGLIPVEISATVSYVPSSSVTTGAELAGEEKETPACAARENGI